MNYAIRRTLFSLAVLTLLPVCGFSQRDINRSLHGVNVTSIEQEIALGRQLAAEVERQIKLLDDPAVRDSVNQIAQNIASHSDAKMPVIIKIVDSTELNAFTLPGGLVYINRGVVDAAGDEAELAAVIAYQIGHVAARHSTEMLTKAELVRTASTPLIFAYRQQPYIYWQGTAAPRSGAFALFVRKDVSEADVLGVQYLYKTGYDPQAAVRMLRKVQALETLVTGQMYPVTSDRIKAVENAIKQLLKK